MSSKQPEIKELNADLVVVGAGGGGMSAAVSAAQLGVKNIIILEKKHAPGGNALWPPSPIFVQFEGGAHVNRVPSYSQVDKILSKSKDIVAEMDEDFRRAMEWSHWRANPRLVRSLIKNAVNTVQWLIDIGAPPATPGATPPGALVKLLIKIAKEMNIQIITDMGANKLLTDNQGKINGIMAEGKAGQIKINTKSVIMSTGGFLGNKELMKKYFHSYTDNIYDEIFIAGMAHNGDALLMASELGACVEGTCAFEWEGNRYPWLTMSSAIVDAVDNYLHQEPIWINKHGERFADETNWNATNTVYLQPQKAYYTIFDEAIKQKMINGPHMTRSDIPYAERLEKELKEQGAKGRVLVSESLDEIAEFIGVNGEVLKANIDEYNEFCDKGHDDLFAKNPKFLIPLRTPPYYCIRCGLNMILSRGPLKVSERMEVVDKDSNPIPGLYAAGVDIGGTDSDTYCFDLPFHSYAFSVSSGRCAAINAINYLEGK